MSRPEGKGSPSRLAKIVTYRVCFISSLIDKRRPNAPPEAGAKCQGGLTVDDSTYTDDGSDDNLYSV
jgi:hypothetical protein